MRVIHQVSRAISVFLLFASASQAQICREAGSSAIAPLGYSYINCDQTYRDLKVACTNTANPANPGTRPACPAKPMPMISTPLQSIIANYSPYLYAYPRDPNDRSKPYDNSNYTVGTSGGPEKVFQLVGNSATDPNNAAAVKRLSACTTQIKTPQDPTNATDEAKHVRLELDNCANQYILNTAIYPYQRSRARLINDPEISSAPITMDTECQPLRTFNEQENEYKASDYLEAAWKKTLYDPTYRKTQIFQMPAAFKSILGDLGKGGIAGTAEPGLPSGVTLSNPIAPPSPFPDVRLSSIAATDPGKTNYEEIVDPTHPFSPRWDFLYNDRDFYSLLTKAYMSKTDNAVYCAGVKSAGSETDATKKADLEVKVDVLSFRKDKFEDGLLRRVAYNTVCKADTAEVVGNLFVVVATSYCFKPVWSTVTACIASIPFGGAACLDMMATHIPCWKCFGLSGNVDDVTQFPPCTTRYDGKDLTMPGVIGVPSLQSSLDSVLKTSAVNSTLSSTTQNLSDVGKDLGTSMSDAVDKSDITSTIADEKSAIKDGVADAGDELKNGFSDMKDSINADVSQAKTALSSVSSSLSNPSSLKSKLSMTQLTGILKNAPMAGAINLFNTKATCNLPFLPPDDTQTMDKLCHDLRRPYTQINKLKMRYHNPADSKNDVLPNGVPQGLTFKEYFGNHMPYPRLWDTGFPLLKSAASDSNNQPPTDTTGQYTAIVGIGREAAPQSASSDAQAAHKDERCLLGGWGAGSLYGALPQQSFLGVTINLPDPITSWTEFKLYQMRATRQIGISCVGRYEKMFKSGSSENLALMRAGGEWPRRVVSKCSKSTSQCTFMSVADYQTAGSPKSSGDTVYAIQTKEEAWPLAWRGYMSTTDGTNTFPYFGGSGTFYTGLDNAKVGDLILLPRGAATASSKPGLAKIGFVTVQADANCATDKSCHITVEEADNGKWPDSCGITDNWGSMQVHQLYKPGNLPALATSEFKRIQYTQSCEDSKLSPCEMLNWDTVQVYRVAADVRTGCAQATAEGCTQ